MTRPPKARLGEQAARIRQAMDKWWAERLDQPKPIDGLYDDGRLVATGDRPADWYRAAARADRGSDRG